MEESLDQFAFDFPSFDWESLHIDHSELPTKLAGDASTDNSFLNSIEDGERLDLGWLNDPTLFGNSHQACESTADDGIVRAWKQPTSNKESMANGVSISPLINNWSASSPKNVLESSTGLTENSAVDANNGPIVQVDDSDFDISKFLGLECTASLKRRKLTDKTFKVNNEIDGLLEAIDETDEMNVKCKTHKKRSLESDNFDSRKLNEVRSSVVEVGSLHQIDTQKYFSDSELMTLDTKELNRRVRSLPKHVVDEIKHRRRTLKNRGYARLCRDKKNNETNNLKEDKGNLEKELAAKKLQLAVMKLERDDWKQKCRDLALHIKKLGVITKMRGKQL